MEFLKNNYVVYEDLKKDYLQQVKKLHPDNGGKEEDFKILQKEFDDIAKKIHNKHYDKNNNIYTSNEEYNGNFKNIINDIIKYNDINIIIIGRWVWINGNTKPKKEIFKKLKFRYSGSKQSWYYHDGKFYKGNGANYTIEELKEIYGYNEIKKQLQIA